MRRAATSRQRRRTNGGVAAMAVPSAYTRSRKRVDTLSKQHFALAGIIGGAIVLFFWVMNQPDPELVSTTTMTTTCEQWSNGKITCKQKD